MKNVTNDKLLNLLSELAIEKLELIPKWVQKNYPELVNENFEVLEGGQIALVVKIAEKYVIKLFLPKFGTNSNYEIGKQVTVNYCNLKSSKFDLSQFGIMLFCELDDILNVPILVLEYYKNTESLANILYKLDYDSRCQYVSKLVVELKKFNQPIANFDYDTQQILDTFDSELKKHSSKIDQQISDKFLEIRNKITPKIVKQDIFLIHNDIHLENILIDRLGDLKIIDFDFCHFAPLFLEIEIIFLFCFLPISVVSKSLENFYREPMTEVFDQIIAEYPEINSSDFKNEIRLLFAIQLIPKLGDPKFEKNCEFALKHFLAMNNLEKKYEISKYLGRRA